MKRAALLSATAIALAMLAGTATAQVAPSATFAKIDTDSSGTISYSEAEATFGTRGADGLFRNDADANGELTVGELVDGGSAVTSESEAQAVLDPATTEVEYTDLDRGHGNDPDGFDDDNPGRGHDREAGERGGGNGKDSNNDRGNGRDGD